MSRLIDADKAKEVLTKLLYETALNNSGGASLMCEDIAENRLETWFGLVPTVDAVEVVRCKDCWNSLAIPKEMQNYAERYCEVWCAEMNDDDYCSCGKRRKDETG